MVSDEEIVERLREILSQADLNVTTIKTVRKQLESEYGVDLSERKALLRQEVENYLKSAHAPGNNEGVENGEGPEKKKRKPRRTKAEIELEKEGKTQGKGKKAKDGEEKGKGKGRKPKKERKKRKTHNDDGTPVANGLNKICLLSDTLTDFLGERELPRTQVVKSMWDYIKKNNLQDQTNKRKIICDDTLRKIFGVDDTDMFQMNKLLSKHISPKPGPNGELPEKKAPRDPNAKRQSTFSRLLPISPELSEFFGDHETHMKRSDIVKKMWRYIKEHNLQDPNAKKNIICDDKLKTLLGIDEFVGFTITKLVSPHILKGPGLEPPKDAAEAEAGAEGEGEEGEGDAEGMEVGEEDEDGAAEEDAGVQEEEEEEEAGAEDEEEGHEEDEEDAGEVFEEVEGSS